MRVVRFGFFFALSVGFSGLGCGSPQVAPPDDPPAGSASAASTGAPMKPALSPPTSALATEKGRTACGTGTCAAGTEICCAPEGVDAACAEAPADLPAENAAAFPKLARACVPSPKAGEGLNGSFSLCDDSGDCGTGEVCCEAAFDSDMGAAVRRCTSNRGACAAPEICREGTCSTPGTTCTAEKGGQCRPSGVKMACGKETCSGATPVCYAAPSASGKGFETKCGKVGVRPEGDNAPSTAYECASSKDCPQGTVCGGSGNGDMGTLCVSFVDYSSTAVACAVAADCNGVTVPFSPDMKLTCQKAGGPSKLSFCLPPK